MGLIDTIRGPRDVRDLTADELRQLCREIRAFLVDAVSATGGHLGPNLGAVELTIALHRAFDSPTDAIVWDTGHQAYVHKILTGRAPGFSSLRSRGGLSGYPSRAESEHDLVENSHASTSLSYADGLAKAWELTGEIHRRHVVAVIGDGALTGGMAWEALNNIAGAKHRPLVIVVNDNERSYAPTIGGLADHLATLRTTRGYERFLDWGRDILELTRPGTLIYEALHGVKKGIKDVIAPQGMFEDLGLKYIGPVDGHDVEAMEKALTLAKGYGGPVIVHAITRKGHGYGPAEADEADRFHGIGVIDPLTGRSTVDAAPTWTSVFAEEIVQIADERADIVAITAAMLGPTGLTALQQRYPHRVFDVGIAEQHAVTSATGMAMGGLHPVVAVYATFLNRAFDQVLLDAALHNAGVTFVLDRAGITGDDGASHNGMWDLAMLQSVPGLRIAAPRDGITLRQELREALDVADAPTVVRFPKGALPEDIPAISREGEADVLRRGSPTGVLIVAVGAMAGLGLQVADELDKAGVSASVVDPRWVKPVDPALVTMARASSLVVTMEDGLKVGGVGASVAQALREGGSSVAVRHHGVPLDFLSHGRRAEVLADCGLTVTAVVHDTLAALDAAALSSAADGH
ncbi:MAG TPA: 1-deoxy-D-xylulose-5-phosphate synthase [Actinobacteria bacterium]|nr:1-deoxy-D-xylulose-5-phosphate synthase [Actinomycetota bacterium]HCK78878.1 1-deoxy-D-xylulose-5-phosphate synthase [Actinomycetota bacterium]